MTHKLEYNVKDEGKTVPPLLSLLSALVAAGALCSFFQSSRFIHDHSPVPAPSFCATIAPELFFLQRFSAAIFPGGLSSGKGAIL